MDNSVRRTVLGNGVTILTKKVDHVRSVSMGVWVNVGARDESLSENGLSHFIEHMLFKGTEKRSAYQIAKDFDAIGGQTNAFTSMENTCYHARVMDTHLDVMAEMLSDIFLNSVFSSGEVDNERPVVLSEIGMLEDTPDEYVHTVLEEKFWGDHPLGRSILGTRENVASFDATQIKRFFKKFYHPEKIIISAAGNVEHGHLVELLGDAFEAIKPGEDLPERTTPAMHSGLTMIPRDLDQVHLCVGNPGFSVTDPRRFAVSLLNTIIGGNMSSRLFQEIREKRGLAYSVYSFTSSNIDSGLFGVYAGVSPENMLKTLESIIGEQKKICTTPIDPSELKDAMEYTKGNILLSAESMDNQMMRLAQNEIHFNRHVPLAEVMDHISRVTASDIKALAESFFFEKKNRIAILGPVTEGSSIEQFLETLTK